MSSNDFLRIIWKNFLFLCVVFYIPIPWLRWLCNGYQLQYKAVVDHSMTVSGWAVLLKEHICNYIPNLITIIEVKVIELVNIFGVVNFECLLPRIWNKESIKHLELLWGIFLIQLSDLGKRTASMNRTFWWEPREKEERRWETCLLAFTLANTFIWALAALLHWCPYSTQFLQSARAGWRLPAPQRTSRPSALNWKCWNTQHGRLRSFWILSLSFVK